MFQGSIVALVTPMYPDGSIHWQQLESLIEWHIHEESDGIVVVGSTGESTTLTLDEHKSVMRFTVEIAKNRIPIIAGAGSNATHEAIELTLAAYQVGCDATLQVCPYYSKPPQRALYSHFKTIAQAAPLPMILYNVPGRTSCDIAPETTCALSRIDNIVGIKEATPLDRLRILRKQLPKEQDFKIFSGEDALCAQAVAIGDIDGVISVTANVAPRLMAAMMRAGLSGDSTRCLALDEKLAPLHDALFVETNPIPVKWALHYMQKIDIGIRSPLVVLDEAKQATVIAALQQAELI